MTFLSMGASGAATDVAGGLCRPYCLKPTPRPRHDPAQARRVSHIPRMKAVLGPNRGIHPRIAANALPEPRISAGAWGSCPGSIRSGNVRPSGRHDSLSVRNGANGADAPSGLRGSRANGARANRGADGDCVASGARGAAPASAPSRRRLETPPKRRPATGYRRMRDAPAQPRLLPGSIRPPSRPHPAREPSFLSACTDLLLLGVWRRTKGRVDGSGLLLGGNCNSACTDRLDAR